MELKLQDRAVRRPPGTVEALPDHNQTAQIYSRSFILLQIDLLSLCFYKYSPLSIKRKASSLSYEFSLKKNQEQDWILEFLRSWRGRFLLAIATRSRSSSKWMRVPLLAWWEVMIIGVKILRLRASTFFKQSFPNPNRKTM
jgi:hypothetical protein